MVDELKALLRKLNRLFWTLTILAVAVLLVVYLLHQLEVPISPRGAELRDWGISLLILSVTLGVALPILLRTLFNRKAVQAKRVAMAAFVEHHQRLVAIPISAAYAAAVAYLLLVPNLYLYGSVLAGLYGIYSAYPQERKIKGEMRYYGLGGE
jgi:hypothetical protein